MGLVCQFVDSIAAAPSLRLDLDADPWTTKRDTDFGFPQLRRAGASTLLTDGEHISASAYGNRILSLRLQVDTASVDDTATEVQKLVRELNRPANLLRTQLGSAPVFFRTFRSSPDRWLIHTDGSFLNIDAEVIAEPFALGLREDPVVLATVDTNPANANGCFLDVTGVKGDVEAPAIIRWPSSAIVDDRETVFATRRRGAPSGAPFLLQAEAMTQGTNTTTQVNDVNFSGGGNNYSRCTFTTATMQTRLSILDLGTPSVDLRGRYRVLLRYRKNTSTDGINLQLRWGDADGWAPIDNDVYATPNITTITTAHLGEISIPVGQDPVVDPATGVEMVVSDSFSLALRAERTSGAGTIDFDFLLLVPADDRFGIVHWNDDSTSPTDHWILATVNGSSSAHARDSSDQIISAGAPILPSLPMLSPNQTNRIYMLRSTRPADAWNLTTIPNVSISYQPRYLSVRPAAT